jgi:hypothetical protein
MVQHSITYAVRFHGDVKLAQRLILLFGHCRPNKKSVHVCVGLR